jgi:hypothetical protein
MHAGVSEVVGNTPAFTGLNADFAEIEGHRWGRPRNTLSSRLDVMDRVSESVFWRGQILELPE